jgi:hypothetical protein
VLNVRSLLLDYGSSTRAVLNERSFKRILVTILALDIAFILVHIVSLPDNQIAQNLKDSLDERFRMKLRIDHDRSYSEIYEYAKSLLCIVGLLRCYSRARNGIYVAITSIFTLILADNAFRMHELIGSVLMREFPSIGQNKGEFIAFLVYLAASAALLWRTFPALSSRHAAFAACCLCCIGVIAFFAIGVDALTAVVPRVVPNSDEAMTLLEDGGELIALSLSLAFIWAVSELLKRA